MNKYWFYKVGLVVVFLCFVLQGGAKVKLPALVSDGMVLQHGRNVNLWGAADANENISITFLKKKYKTVADAEGNWKLTLPAMKPGGPYTMTINDIHLKDILIGDVWLCSGQSNMELPVSRVTDKFRDEITADSHYPMVRYIKTPLLYNFHAPQTDIPGLTWKTLTPENAMSFSALVYFFAKDLYQKTGIPVGIINSSVGGSPVEAWISEEAITPFPRYLNEKRMFESDDLIETMKREERKKSHAWNVALYQGDKGLHEATPWYAADYDDSNWTPTELFSKDWATNGLNPINGSHWFRKDFQVTDRQAGQKATLRMGCIVDADSVYVNGVFVGTVSYQYPPRIYTIPEGVLKKGKNTITVRLISNGGRPHFVKDKPYKILFGKGQPEKGESEINLEGTWKYRLGAPMPPAPGQTFFQYKPVGLYNAMIAPLLNYTVSGAIWYQGESNVSNRNEYKAMLTALIADWRQRWNQPDMPFFIIELADFLSAEDKGGRAAWAEFRKVQAETAEANKNVTLIKNSDLGEWNDIHPLDKKTVGQRVSQAVFEQKGKTNNQRGKVNNQRVKSIK